MRNSHVRMEAQGPFDPSTGSTPFACNVCGRSYSRVDHLARHFRSHTKERPFACETCGKHFSRADLLRRHATAHNNQPRSRKRVRPSSPAPSRVSLACTACSTAKVKCEEGKPCSRCYQKGIPCVTPAASNGARVHVPLDDQPVRGRDTTQGLQHETPVGMEKPTVPSHDQSSDTFLQWFSRQKETTQADSASQPALSPQHLSVNMPHMQPICSSGDGMAVAGVDPWFDSSLGDFLTDVMMPGKSPSNGDPSIASNAIPARNLLDFGVDDGIDFDDFDFALFDTHPAPPPHPFHSVIGEESTEPPSRADEGQEAAVDVRASEAFQRSLWRFIPNQLDRGQCEQMHLSLPAGIGATSARSERVCHQRLGQSARDKVMAIVMDTCDQANLLQIVSHFPSADVLDCFVQDYLFFIQSRAVSHIHIPTFEPNTARPETIAMMAACGAIRNEATVVRKLGYALQEAVRLALPKAFEQDNSTTRDVHLLRSYLMHLDVGIWSGNKRKMEISESHLLPLVTMLRRSGRFQRCRPSADVPNPADTPDTLDKKWRAWVEVESCKRLVFATALHDAANSSSFFVPPLITYSEVSLELPACEKLWKASSAQAWSDAFLLQVGPSKYRLPNVASCMRDEHTMLAASDWIDMGFCKQILLGMFWTQIWTCQQLSASTNSAITGGSSTGMALASSHWQQDLAQSIRHFRMTVSDADKFEPPVALIYEHLMLNIYVSLDEVSRFAGKEGIREARQAFPLLRQWAQSQDSRHAVWHAGQILSEARKFQPGTLRDFPAIALYHAGVTLWAYGVVTNKIGHVHGHGGMNRTVSTDAIGFTNVTYQQHTDIAVLDDSDSAATQKFIALGRGVPAIRRSGTTQPPKSTLAVDEGDYVSLDQPQVVMETAIRVLQQNHEALDKRPILPLIENLTRLMHDLSYAASRINVT